MENNDDLELSLIIEMNRSAELRSQIYNEIDEINSFILKYESFKKSDLYNSTSFQSLLNSENDYDNLSDYNSFEATTNDQSMSKINNNQNYHINNEVDEHKEGYESIIDIFPKLHEEDSRVVVNSINYVEQSDLLFGFLELKERLLLEQQQEEQSFQEGDNTTTNSFSSIVMTGFGFQKYLSSTNKQ